MALLVVCFGSSFYFNVLALEAFNPLAAGAARLIIAAAFLLPISLLSGHGLPTSLQMWLWALLLGTTAFAAPFYLVVWAQSHVPSNVAAFFFAAIPLLLLVLSRLFLGTVITRRKWLGLMVGCVGLVILAGPGTLAQVGVGDQYLPQLAIFLACILLAGAAIIIRVMPRVSSIKINAGAMLAAAVLSMPVAISEIPLRIPPVNALVGLLGIVSTAIGQLTRFVLIRRRGPIFLTPNGYLVAIFAVFLGVFCLGEELTMETLLAFSIILIGLLIAQDGSGKMDKA